MEFPKDVISLSDVGADAFCNFLAARASLQLGHISGKPEQAETATFQGDLVQPDKVRPHSHKVQDDLVTVWRNLPFSGRDWNQDADYVKASQQRAIESGQASRIVYRMREYDDGYQRIQLMAVENPDYVYVHKYRDDLYKVVILLTPPEPGNRGTGQAVKTDDERWYENLHRAKLAIEELSLCNDWQYFVTLTIDGEKLSRSDLENFRKKLQQMIRDYRRKHGADIDYLFVPELHPRALKDGRIEWHLHGLITLPDDCLVPFENRKKYGANGDKFPPRYIRDKIIRNEPVYYWKQYATSFGNSVLEPVRNRDASARYLMKYVSKKQGETAQHLKKGQNLYYHSTGLKRAEKVTPDNWRVIKRQARSGFEKRCENCIVFWYEL